MKHLEDKRVCPNCGHEHHERPYLMARASDELVMSPTMAAWIVVAVSALLVAVNLAA